MSQLVWELMKWKLISEAFELTWCDRSVEIVDGPADDHIVVEADIPGNENGTVADAFQGRIDFRPQSDWAGFEELTDGKFEKEQRQCTEKQHQRVGYEEDAYIWMEKRPRSKGEKDEALKSMTKIKKSPSSTYRRHFCSTSTEISTRWPNQQRIR